MNEPSLIFRICSALRHGFRVHGLKFPFTMIHRSGLYLGRRLFTRPTFVFNGREYHYLIHPFILNNERAVEIAIAREFLKDKRGKILEVGNVLSNYFSFPHDVVDKYEVAPGVINEDIISYRPNCQYDTIVTLSTLEHVGWDESPREPEKILRAIHQLKEMLSENGQLLATMPIGHNSFLDQLIRDRATGFSEVKYLIRISANNRWREAEFGEAIHSRYGHPFPCANAIMVGVFEKSKAR